LTDEQRQARQALAELTPAAARKLAEMVDSPDERVALRACCAVLRFLPPLEWGGDADGDGEGDPGEPTGRPRMSA